MYLLLKPKRLPRDGRALTARAKQQRVTRKGAEVDPDRPTVPHLGERTSSLMDGFHQDEQNSTQLTPKLALNCAVSDC